MLNIAILPNDSSSTCLCIRTFLTSLPATLLSSIHIQPTATTATDAIIWLPNIAQGDTSALLRAALDSAPRVRFVQLPMTGVDDFAALIRERGDIVWCCAKGCYAALVAEHALALALTVMRGLHPRGEQNDSLTGANVLVVGRGSIASELSALLAPFRCTITHTDSTSTRAELLAALSPARVVFLACPLTHKTERLFDATTLAAMHPSALLVNVARGQIVDTAALVAALDKNPQQRAALDVVYYACTTEWDGLVRLRTEGRVVVTDHAAIPAQLIPEMLGERLRWNLQVLVDGEEGKAEWKGRVDPDKGY